MLESLRVSPLYKLTRLAAFAPFVVALVVFVFMVFTTAQLISFPDDGIDTLINDGKVVSLDPNGPSYGKLQEGDVILSVDGVPYSTLNYIDLRKSVGDSVSFEVYRDGAQVGVTFELTHPSRDLLFSRLVAIFVALIFWGIGLGVDAFKPTDKGSSIFSLWFYTCALILITGAASTMRIGWATVLFNSLFWLLGSLSVHFHMLFPQSVVRKENRGLLVFLYLITLLGIAPIFLFGAARLESFAWYSSYLSAGKLFLAPNLIIVVGLLFYSYRNAETPGVRGRIRLVLFGGVLVAAPFVILTILPGVLFNKPLIPYSSAFLLLALLPLTYGFAIFRFHLIEIDQQINRGATYLLVYSTLGGFYLILYAILTRWIPEDIQSTPLINTVLVLALASVFIPLHQRAQRMVDRVFYGGWYDYRTGVRLITENLSQITDLENLSKTVSERLMKILRLEEAVVFLRDQSGDFSVVEASFSGGIKDRQKMSFPVLPRSSLTYLLKIGVSERTALMQEISQVTLTPEEVQLLRTEQIHLWVPVIGHGQIQGLLALGPKLGGDVFSAEDMDILRVLVQQLSPVIENIHLLMDLKEHANELEKRVEERTIELYDAKERVETVLASVGDGVVVVDLDGRIQTVNRAFERLSGFSALEVRGDNLFQILAAENGFNRITAMRDSLRGGDIWSDELVGRRKDGGQYNIQFTIATIRDRHGKPVGYVGSQTDITRQKELDRMKDTFISDVSHELRTPITNISLYVELLKSAPIERYARYLNVVKEQSEVLTKLVEDILDLSRLTATKTRPVTFTKADLNQLVAQVITAYKPLADVSGLTLNLIPDSELPAIYVEQNQIARMITNLVTNAIRYTPKGQVRVVTCADQNGVCLIVQDTGIGIDPQDIPHIFERFFRGRNVRQSEMHGTGLGLAIVKEIVDFHGGQVEVQSEPGKGTIFRVWLPVNRA